VGGFLELGEMERGDVHGDVVGDDGLLLELKVLEDVWLEDWLLFYIMLAIIFNYVFYRASLAV
jgi:hypothetical protein